MKHDTAANKTLSRLQKEKHPQFNLSLGLLESVYLKSCGQRKSDLSIHHASELVHA